MPGRRLGRLAAAIALLLTTPAAAQQDALPPIAGHPRGQPTARLQVIEFSDFGCGYCTRFALETFPKLEKEFVATGRVRWVYVPVVLVGFPHSDRAAEAAECAGEQDAFWPMHDSLFAGRSRWARQPAERMREYAREIGIDTVRFARCTESRAMRDRVERHTKIAWEAGARATPTFFVNGRRVVGALFLADFRAILLQELAKLDSVSVARVTH